MLAQYGPILYIMLFSVLAIYGCYRFIDWFEREQPVEKWKAGKGEGVVRTWVVDTAPAFQAAVKNPKAYEAKDALCYNADGVSCLWFNDYHPGQAIQKMVGAAVQSAVGL